MGITTIVGVFEDDSKKQMSVELPDPKSPWEKRSVHRRQKAYVEYTWRATNPPTPAQVTHAGEYEFLIVTPQRLINAPSKKIILSSAVQHIFQEVETAHADKAPYPINYLVACLGYDPSLFPKE
jgi:hypothetical protein